jgi:hypothetical protein
MVVKTISTFHNYVMEFEVGVEFEEDLRIVDGRKCQVLFLRLEGEGGMSRCLLTMCAKAKWPLSGRARGK